MDKSKLKNAILSMESVETDQESLLTIRQDYKFHQFALIGNKTGLAKLTVNLLQLLISDETKREVHSQAPQTEEDPIPFEIKEIIFDERLQLIEKKFGSDTFKVVDSKPTLIDKVASGLVLCVFLVFLIFLCIGAWVSISWIVGLLW